MAYSPEERERAITTLCHLIATGKDGIRQICEKNPELPSASTFMKWLSEDTSFSERYAHAREEQADGIAGEIISIADAELDGSGFKNIDDNEKDNLALSAANSMARLELEQRRQQIEARKWVAAKLKPGVYGDRLNVNADVTVKIPDEQLESRLAFLIGKAGTALAVGGTGAESGETKVLPHVPEDGAAST